MKKQELIHLHGLLSEVRAEYEDEELDMAEYEELGVKPTSIHRSKTAHKDAVFRLADCLTDSLSESERVVQTAD